MDAVMAWLRERREHHCALLADYLRIPSISSDPDSNAQVAECARFTAQLLHDAGLEQVRVHSTPRHPAVTGCWRHAPGRPTLLLYGHYDVQPVDPLNAWQRPPFDPHQHNDRMVARGSADDKGQLLMHILAVKALLQTQGTLPVNVVFLLEGEEEIGSPGLPEFLRQHKALLQADVAVVSDSFMWGEHLPAITVSLRGLTLLEVCVQGPNRDLHSGSYGGAVANPVEILARLLAQVKDESGQVRIPGFYDAVRPIAPEQQAQMAAVPFDRADYLAELGVRTDWGEANYSILERIWLRPTFEINGLWGGFTGEGSKTVLPATAHAKLSMRLVADQDPDEIAAQVTAFLTQNAPEYVTVTVTRLPGGGKPIAIPTNLPAMQAAKRALQESFGRPPLMIREGVSIPIVSDFRATLGLETLLLGFALPDSRTHSPNENFHLPTFHTGTEALVRFYQIYGAEKQQDLQEAAKDNTK